MKLNNKKIWNIVKNKDNGISLISLIITIIVIIILAAIVIFTGLNTPDSAQFAKFTQDVDNVQMAVTNKFADLKTKHAIAKESRTDEQIYLEIATGEDHGMDKFMCTAGSSYKKSSDKSTEIQNIIPEKAKASIGMELPKVREYDTAWYVTKEGRVFNANGYAYNDKTYFDAKTYQQGELGSNSTINANRAEVIYSVLSSGNIIVAGAPEKGNSEPTIVLEAGLYSITTGELDKSWEQLIQEDVIKVENGVVSAGNNSNRVSILTGKIVFPDDINEFSSGVFANCTGLKGDLVIPSSMRKIGGGSFSNCSGLSGNLIIEYGVTEIGGGAFYNCSGLTGRLVIPYSVTTLGGGCFSNCGSSGVLKSLEITMSSIPSNGNFSGIKSEKLILGNGVSHIYEGAFAGCSGLLGELVIPESVTYVIGSGAFNGCSGFTKLVLGNNVSGIGNSAFFRCTGLQGNLTIPASVNFIENNAFAGCAGLSSLEISDGVVSIFENAFAGCTGITGNLTIPNSVSTVSKGAFAGCGSENELTNLEINQSYILKDSYSSIKTAKLTIGNNVKEIYPDAFNGFDEIKILEIGNNVKKIHANAFYGCSGLTGNLTLPNSLTMIDKDAFSGCTGFTKIVVPSTVTSVYSPSFSNVQNVEYSGTLTGAPWGAKKLNGV